MDAVRAAALADAAAYQKGGADAVIIENFGDVPFSRSTVPPETVAAMSAVGARIAAETSFRLPIGYNVLRNDSLAGLGLAIATGAGFIRVNVHCGAMVTDQGLIEGNAFETIRKRRQLCPDVAILADVHVKHARPLAGGKIGEAAEELVQRGLVDGLIVSGTGTGKAVDFSDLERVRAACPEAPLFVGSGANTKDAEALLRTANGLIVGTSVKRAGQLANPVDPTRVAALREAVDRAVS